MTLCAFSNVAGAQLGGTRSHVESERVFFRLDRLTCFLRSQPRGRLYAPVLHYAGKAGSAIGRDSLVRN